MTNEPEDPVITAAENEVQEWIKEMTLADARLGAESDLKFAPATSRVAVELIRMRVELTAIRQALEAMAKASTLRAFLRTPLSLILLSKIVRSQAQSRCSILTAFEQKLIQVEWLGAHREISISLARPLLSRSVPVKFHAVAIRIAKVNRLTHSMIGSSFERNAGP